ncbi:MAG: hypothetical protein RL419_600, partial [Actinomycetota bacterium]
MALNGIDPSSIPTVASQLRARLGDDRMGYVLDDERYTWHEVALQSAVRGAMLR